MIAGGVPSLLLEELVDDGVLGVSSGDNVNVEPSVVTTMGVVTDEPGGSVVITVWPLLSVKVSTTELDVDTLEPGVKVKVEVPLVITIGVVMVFPGGKVVVIVFPLPSDNVSTTELDAVTSEPGVRVKVEVPLVMTTGVVIVLPGGRVVVIVFPLPSDSVSTTELEGVALAKFDELMALPGDKVNVDDPLVITTGVVMVLPGGSVVVIV